MKVNAVELVISAASSKQYPKSNLPEIAMAGRSNVGKSSFINKLINRKVMARISSKPGKTQTLNFYNIDNFFMFVDVPGYGYAAVSKGKRAKFGQMMEEYFTTRENLQTVCLLTDARHLPTEDDILMYNFLKHYNIPTVVIMTKIDKVPKSLWKKHEQLHKEALSFHRDDKLILFSSVTGYGKSEIWNIILDACK